MFPIWDGTAPPFSPQTSVQSVALRDSKEGMVAMVSTEERREQRPAAIQEHEVRAGGDQERIVNSPGIHRSPEKRAGLLLGYELGKDSLLFGY